MCLCLKAILTNIRLSSLYSQKDRKRKREVFDIFLLSYCNFPSTITFYFYYLQVSITLLRPWKCDLLLYLANHMNMNIKIERKEWNDSENVESEDIRSDSTSKDVTIEKTNDYDESYTANTSRDSLSEIYTQNVTFNENVISGNFAEIESVKLESLNESIKQTDFENISWMDAITLDKQLNACSTPQPQSEEEKDSLNIYKQLIIPQETKYIELILCFNEDPITSFAQVAENNDAMFSNVGIRRFLLNTFI